MTERETERRSQQLFSLHDRFHTGSVDITTSKAHSQTHLLMREIGMPVEADDPLDDMRVILKTDNGKAVSLNLTSGLFFIGLQEVTTFRLTWIQIKIMSTLLEHQGNVVNRFELIDSVWNGSHNIKNPERNLRVHIKYLRRTLSKIPGFTDHIGSIRNQGYIWRS